MIISCFLKTLFDSREFRCQLLLRATYTCSPPQPYRQWLISFNLFNPWEWSASYFSYQYHPRIKHQVMRIKETIINQRTSLLWNKFSLQAHQKMYRDQNGECAYWWYGVKGLSSYILFFCRKNNLLTISYKSSLTLPFLMLGAALGPLLTGIISPTVSK